MNSNEQAFLTYIDSWLADLPAISQSEIFAQPEKTAILSVDMINGFCKAGNLASPRVGAIIEPVVELFNSGWDAGVRQFVLVQDCHPAEAVEFGAFAEHAVCGSEEAEAVDEIRALPFYKKMTTISKNSISPAENTDFDQWLADHAKLDTFIVVGDCTDLCTYSLALHLRVKANAFQKSWRVVVPEDCVATYDLPVETAKQIGAMPHNGDLLHKIFLYHMALNGIEVVKGIG